MSEKSLRVNFLRPIGAATLGFLATIGQLSIFMVNAVSHFVRPPIYFRLIGRQMIDVGYYSLPVVGLTTLFSGMVIALQSYTGAARVTEDAALAQVSSVVVLAITRELAPVLAGLMVAGRIGAAMAAEIGTMRVTEQIDALEVMGINSVNFLVFPKLIAMTLLPIVIIFSMFLGIFGGWAATIYGGFSSSASFIEGIQLEFNSFHVVYAFVKTFLFAIILATIPSYHGYYMKGGALDVGRASTVSFVWCSVVIIVVNYFITQLFFS